MKEKERVINFSADKSIKKEPVITFNIKDGKPKNNNK